MGLDACPARVPHTFHHRGPPLWRPSAGRSAVPLSEHEQRLLDQIERALYAEDPKFASSVRASDLRTHLRRRTRRGIALFLIGFARGFVGLPAEIWISIVGFVLMVFAAFIALMSWKRLGTRGDNRAQRPAPPRSGIPRPNPSPKPNRPVGARPARSPKPARSKSSFMVRLEERWRRRWEDRGRC